MNDIKVWINPDDLPKLEESGITIKDGANPEELGLDEVIIDPSKNEVFAALMESVWMPTANIRIETEDWDIPEWGSMRAYLNWSLVEWFSLDNPNIPLQDWSVEIKIEFLNKNWEIVWEHLESTHTDNLPNWGYLDEM